jgi:hypothetical protein
MEPWLIHDEERSTSDPDSDPVSAPGFGSGLTLWHWSPCLKGFDIYIYIYICVSNSIDLPITYSQVPSTFSKLSSHIRFS